MGGIAGIFHRRGGSVDPGLLARQAEALAHRGPVGASLWTDGPVGLVHRKDRVVPTICPGDQPLSDASGRYHIVCNGRIFNAPRLAIALRDAGVALRSESILEVMLEAYRRWGVEALTRFNGAFACAIWDAEERVLLLARDQVGIKPLFYSMSDGTLRFASEIKGILADPDHPKRPDEIGIAEYLACHRFLFQSETTVYQGVRRLLPARVLRVAERASEPGTYWQLHPARLDTYGDDGACVEAVRDLLVDAVRIRMPDSRRVGAALSGGFDSSSIVCLIDHLNGKERAGTVALDTFSFTFDSPDADETELAELVARKAGAVHHHVHVLRPDLFDPLDEIIALNDGPTVESSVLLLWNKKQAVRKQGIDVLFSGLGGDELFMGELTYLADLFRRGRWIAWVKEMRSVYPRDPSTGKRTSLPELVRSYVLGPLQPDWLRAVRRSHLGRRFPPDWMAADLIARTGVGRVMPRRHGPRFPTLYAQYCHDVFHYDIGGANLPFHDVAGSAFAVDTRFPLLDVRLVEALFALPRTWKIHMGEIRPLQKRAMAFVLPPEVLRQHVKKVHHPVLNAFQRSIFRDRLGDFFGDRPRASDAYLDWPTMRGYYGAFVAGRLDNPYPLWLALNLERWLDRM